MQPEPGGHLDAEGWFDLLLAHAGSGEALDLAGDDPDPDPSRADPWPADRCIPADALRRALLELQRHPDRADPRGLRIVGADFGERIDLENLRVPCPLWLERSRLRAGADLDGAHLIELSLAHSHLVGPADTPAAAAVRAVGATITGQLSLRGVTVSNEGGVALRLDGASIGGGAFLDQGFTATGAVSALGATITGQLNLRGATLSNEGGDALILQGARVAELHLVDLAGVDGRTVMVGCEVGTLVLDQEADQPPAGHLVADGWQIQIMHGQMASDVGLAEAWLDSRPTGLPYTPQPARAVAEVYDRAGHPDQARRLRYSAARKVARQAPGWARPWLYTYDALVGHGYYPLRTLGWLAIFLIVAGALTTASPDMFAPTDPARAVAASTAAATTRPGQVPPGPDDISGATPCEDLGLYPCFDPVPYALQTVVPPAAAVQATAWQPTGWMLAAITALKASGWILVALLLAGITGLLRRT